MKLTLDSYTVSRETLEAVLSALGDNWFTLISGRDGYADEYNNDDVIDADKRLQAELLAQEPDKQAEE